VENQVYFLSCFPVSLPSTFGALPVAPAAGELPVAELVEAGGAVTELAEGSASSSGQLYRQFFTSTFAWRLVAMPLPSVNTTSKRRPLKFFTGVNTA